MTKQIYHSKEQLDMTDINKPDNTEIMYVTDANAGVFKSLDSGKTWFPSNSGFTTGGGHSGDSIPIFCLTVDPNNHKIIWAGTSGGDLVKIDKSDG